VPETPTTSAPLIYSKIAAIIADLGAIEKSKNNKEQGFKYRGIDDVYNAIHPLFAKHGVFTAPDILERVQNEHLTKSGAAWKHVVIKVRYTYYAADGSSVESVIYGEGLDNGDKATNKALAVAHKYSLLQMFCVATDDMDDPDARTAPEAQAQRQAPKPAGNGTDKALEEFKAAVKREWKWFTQHATTDILTSILGNYGVEKTSELTAEQRKQFMLDIARAKVDVQKAHEVADKLGMAGESAAPIDEPAPAQVEAEFEEAGI